MIVAREITRGVTKHLRYRFAEWVFSAILGAFGYRLLAPGSTFASSPSYDYMAAWMPEQDWGYAIAVVAVLRLAALGLNGTFRWFRPYSPAVRCATAWFSSVVWFCLFVGFYISNPNATGWGTYAVILAADLSLSVMIAEEATHAYRGPRHADA